MLIVALFTIAKVWKQPMSPFTDEWIKKMWCMDMKYYSAIKKNEILPFAATWKDLEEGIMLSEISQTEKDKYCMISHVESKKYNKLVNITKKKQFTDTEKKLVVTSVGGGLEDGNIGVGK